VKAGDFVYAFDQKTHELVLKKCSGVFNNGKKEVFEISTLHHTIKVTANHPFLILKRNGRGKSNELIWQTVNALKKEDQVVVLKNLDMNKNYKFDFVSSKKGDYKVHKINDTSIPKESSPELMEFLGLFVGDGWVRINRAETGFAIPENDKARQRIIYLINHLFKIKSVRLEKLYVYINSINIAKFIHSLGFGEHAKSKTIPAWVFTLSSEEKEAFLKGMILSDGYRAGSSIRYSSASLELLTRTRLLLQTLGHRVGKIHQIITPKGTLVVKRRLLKDSQCGYICFSIRSAWNIKKYKNQYKYQNFLIENKHFELEKITAIKSKGIEPTLDLRVDGEHNFIANGIVVHNTGIQRSSATPLYANTTTDPVGSDRKGKQELRKDFTEIMVAHNMQYIAQTALSNLNDFIPKVEKAFKKTDETATFVNVFSPCIPGWGIHDGDAIMISKIAVDTCFWPLYEVENGVYTLNYNPESLGKKKPIIEFLKLQSRFKHLLKPENAHLVEAFQHDVDTRWEKLKKRCGI